MVGMLWCLAKGQEMDIAQLDKARRYFIKKYSVLPVRILMNKIDYEMIDTTTEDATTKKGMIWNGITIEPHTYIQRDHLHIYGGETL